MHSLSTNYNEDPFHSATAHSFSRLFSFPAPESCSPFTHAGILPPSEMHRYAARLPACLLARAHAFLVTTTAASIVAGDGLINSFVLVCQHMLRRTHMEWRAAGRGIGCVGRAALLAPKASDDGAAKAQKNNRPQWSDPLLLPRSMPGRGRL